MITSCDCYKSGLFM